MPNTQVPYVFSRLLHILIWCLFSGPESTGREKGVIQLVDSYRGASIRGIVLDHVVVAIDRTLAGHSEHLTSVDQAGLTTSQSSRLNRDQDLTLLKWQVPP